MHTDAHKRQKKNLLTAEDIFKTCAVLSVISRRARTTGDDIDPAWRTVDDIELQGMREEATRHMREAGEDDETLGGLVDDGDNIDVVEANALVDLRMKLTEHYEWWSGSVHRMRADNMVVAAAVP
jgi:hypothetical protein